MDTLLESITPWLETERWKAWMEANNTLALVIAAFVILILALCLYKNYFGIRRAVVNVAGLGFLIWGSLWFADWVKPSLTAEDLFTAPIVGPQAVKAAYVEQKTFEQVVTYTGTVHPFERVILRTRIDGFVEKVSAYPGDRVAAGQLLVQMETSQLRPRLLKARAELKYQHAELKRDQELYKGGATPASSLDLSSSKERVVAATVRLLETEIGYAKVRAPSDGWVSRRVVDPGQFVRKGDQLLAYDRLSRVRLRFDVAIQDLVNIKPGTPVVVEFPEIPPTRLAGVSADTVSGYPGAALKATVTSVFPRADERTRLGVVEVLLHNPDLVLRSDTYAVGHFVTRRVENAWVVPQRAFTPLPDGRTVVFLAPAFSDQGEAEMREVKIGLRNGLEAQVLEGIEEPSYVVVAGNRSLTDGETVEVIGREGESF